jgi:uncharacterized phage-associated protein
MGIEYAGYVINLTDDEEDLFDDVMTVYGKYSAGKLVDLTHSEAPWQSTEIGRGNIITHHKMREFFKSKLI